MKPIDIVIHIDGNGAIFIKDILFPEDDSASKQIDSEINCTTTTLAPNDAYNPPTDINEELMEEVKAELGEITIPETQPNQSIISGDTVTGDVEIKLVGPIIMHDPRFYNDSRRYGVRFMLSGSNLPEKIFWIFGNGQEILANSNEPVSAIYHANTLKQAVMVIALDAKTKQVLAKLPFAAENHIITRQHCDEEPPDVLPPIRRI